MQTHQQRELLDLRLDGQIRAVRVVSTARTPVCFQPGRASSAAEVSAARSGDMAARHSSQRGTVGGFMARVQWMGAVVVSVLNRAAVVAGEAGPASKDRKARTRSGWVGLGIGVSWGGSRHATWDRGRPGRFPDPLGWRRGLESGRIPRCNALIMNGPTSMSTTAPPLLHHRSRVPPHCSH